MSLHGKNFCIHLLKFRYLFDKFFHIFIHSDLTRADGYWAAFKNEDFENKMVLRSRKLVWVCSFVFLGFLFNCASPMAFAQNMTVIIPFGAGNPSFDTPTQEWFSPSVVTIRSGDTVTWTNNDTEIHNVASGKGITRFQFVTTHDLGTPDGLFSSGSFKPKQSWSYTFTKPGTYYYFCSIHPWMNGAVVVNEKIPQVPTDGAGNPITRWPVVAYTLDRKYEADMGWEPHVILTGEKVVFVFQFYDSTGSLILRGTPYDFVIVQNGQEVFRTSGQTGTGGDYKYFVFKNPGTATFMLENIGGSGFSTEYSTNVYQNPNETQTNLPVIQPARNIILGQEFALVLVGPPVVIIIVTILWAKGLIRGLGTKKKITKKEEKRSPL